MRNLIFLPVLLTMSASCDSQPNSSQKLIKPSATALCNVYPANLNNTINIMNRAHNCVAKLCILQNAEGKDLTPGGSLPFLYSGPDKMFSVAEINAFMAEAKNRAMMFVPNGKKILSYIYSGGIATGGNSSGIITVTVIYGACGRFPGRTGPGGTQ